MIATWTRRDTGTSLVVRILGQTTGYEGEVRYRVCKIEADPRYHFTVRADEVTLS